MSGRDAAFLLLVSLLGAYPSAAQVSGTVFEDRDGDGIRDAGEPAIEGVTVALFGVRDAGGAADQVAITGGDGTYAFSPGDGCFLVAPEDPAGWRLSQAREDGFPEGTAPFAQPVGQPRFAKLDRGIANLRSGTLRYTSMGDSIAWNFNLCGYVSSFWYSKEIRSRLACTAPAASVTLDQAAVKGEHTDDLLVDESNDLNNVFRVIEIQPELISISIIGNDLLDVDPGADPEQSDINRAVEEVLDARQNLQETLAALVSEIPGADIVLNTLYDNEAYNCYTGSPSDFHRTWIPVVSRILRDVAWGQARRVSNAEVAAEFAHEDQLGGCTGFDGLICRDWFGVDEIHPTNAGYEVVLEKLWEGAGGANLGTRDVLGRSLLSGVDYGYLRRVRRLLPRNWEVRNGALVESPEAALDDQDDGAPARITLGSGTEELRLTGFPDWYDEVQIVRVIAGVRYRTSGAVADDFYRMEASIDDRFRPDPGHAYTPTDWNFYTPVVGGGGPNQPPDVDDYPDASVLVLPDVPTYRDVSATLTKNPELPPAAADYVWPAVTHEDLAATTVRVASAPVAGTPGNDAYQVELDCAWLDLYGWEKERPPEVADLRIGRLGDGTLELSFDEPSGAQRYNLYAGTMESLLAGAYDHGGNPLCDAEALDAGGGRLAIQASPSSLPAGDAYLLVTGHVDDVESPAGRSSDGAEIDRSQSVCR